MFQDKTGENENPVIELLKICNFFYMGVSKIVFLGFVSGNFKLGCEDLQEYEMVLGFYFIFWFFSRLNKTGKMKNITENP